MKSKGNVVAFPVKPKKTLAQLHADEQEALSNLAESIKRLREVLSKWKIKKDESNIPKT